MKFEKSSDVKELENVTEWHFDVVAKNSLGFSFSNRQLLTLKSKSIVRYFDVPPHGLTLVGGCDDGCFLWRLTDLETTNEKTR